MLAAIDASADEPPAAIRTLAGKHLVLRTDLPASPEIDAIPDLFDQAYDQWCRYFAIDPASHAAWRVTGNLIKAKEHFQAAGHFPADLPPFPSGYSRQNTFWLYDQTSPYYRLHLLLHEGTHCFMTEAFGQYGPPWYAEGMAELLATHKLEAGKLTLNYFPRDRREVPKLGRIEMVQEGYASGKALSFARVLAYDHRAHSQNEPYGWCWAAAAFLEGDPRYHERFHELPKLLSRSNFTEGTTKVLSADWLRIAEDWQIYVANLEYGYDFQRMAVDYQPGKPLAAAGATVTVLADRGWQPSGVRLEEGRTYRLQATGRYQVANKPRVWWCEPNGVTIRYVHGQPLGILLAAVRPDSFDGKSASALVKPTVVGLETTITPARTGTLYLRINDAAGELADNAGTLAVEVSSH